MATPHPDSPSSPKPLVQPRKWTTQVNIAIVAAVVIVFLVGAVFAWRYWQRNKDAPPVHETVPETTVYPRNPTPPASPQIVT